MCRDAIMHKLFTGMQLCRKKLASYAVMQKTLGEPHLKLIAHKKSQQLCFHWQVYSDTSAYNKVLISQMLQEYKVGICDQLVTSPELQITSVNAYDYLLGICELEPGCIVKIVKCIIKSSLHQQKVFPMVQNLAYLTLPGFFAVVTRLPLNNLKNLYDGVEM